MTGWAAAAFVAAFGAVWTSTRGRDTLHRISVDASHGPRLVWRPSKLSAAAGAVIVCVGWLAVVGTLLPIAFGLGGLMAGIVLRRVVRDVSMRGQRRARQVAVIEVCDALSAELRAGLPALQVLERSFVTRAEWASVVSAARLGGDVPEAIRRAATAQGAEGLRAVAAGWEVAHQSGAALATVLERIAAGLRSDDEARSEVTACLGPPRATARLLAVLPVFGLALGSSMGARPITFLLSTNVGLLCLGLGSALACLGIFWVERLAASAEG